MSKLVGNYVQLILFAAVIFSSVTQYVLDPFDTSFFFAYLLSPLLLVMVLRRSIDRASAAFFIFYYCSFIIHSHLVGHTPGRSMPYLQYLIFGWAVYLLANTVRHRTVVLGLFVVLFVFLAALNVIGFGVTGGRQFGIFLDAGINALFSLVGLILVIGRLVPMSKLARIAALILFSASLAFVQSRIVLMLFGGFICFWIYYQWKYKRQDVTSVIVVLLVFSCSQFLFLNSDGASSIYFKTDKEVSDLEDGNGRVQQWRAGLDYLSEEGFSGAGLGSWGEVYPKYRTVFYDYGDLIHNDYLQYLIEAGVLGLTFLLIPFLYVTVRFFRMLVNREGVTQSAYFAALGLGVIFGYAAVNFYFHRFETIALVAVLLSTLVKSGKTHSESSNFQVSKTIWFVSSSFLLIASIYGSSALYYGIYVSNCSRLNSESSFICRGNLLNLYDLIAANDLPKAILYLDEMDRMQNLDVTEASLFEYSRQVSSINLFVNQAEKQGVALSYHYGIRAYANLVMMRRGFIPYSREKIEADLRISLQMNPSNTAAIYTESLIILDFDGERAAIKYLDDFISSPWMSLPKVKLGGQGLVEFRNEIAQNQN